MRNYSLYESCQHAAYAAAEAARHEEDGLNGRYDSVYDLQISVFMSLTPEVY